MVLLVQGLIAGNL